MKLTLNNYKEFVPEKDQELMYNLLIDVNELNDLLDKQGQYYRKLYIDIETHHTEYSPERVDPCPDFYGCYRLHPISDPYNSVGDIMDIDTLDNTLCALIMFLEIKPF